MRRITILAAVAAMGAQHALAQQTEIATMYSEDPEGYDRFGAEMAVKEFWGLIGAIGDDNGQGYSAGAIYSDVNSSWVGMKGGEQVVQIYNWN